MEHEGVLEGPLKAARLEAEWREKRIRETLESFPMLRAVIDGTISEDAYAEPWPALRMEIKRLADKKLRLDRDEALEDAARICEQMIWVNGGGFRDGGKYPRTATQCAEDIRAMKAVNPKAA